jgi:hypothetical protein
MKHQFSEIMREKKKEKISSAGLLKPKSFDVCLKCMKETRHLVIGQEADKRAGSCLPRMQTTSKNHRSLDNEPSPPDTPNIIQPIPTSATPPRTLGLALYNPFAALSSFPKSFRFGTLPPVRTRSEWSRSYTCISSIRGRDGAGTVTGPGGSSTVHTSYYLVYGLVASLYC